MSLATNPAVLALLCTVIGALLGAVGGTWLGHSLAWFYYRGELETARLQREALERKMVELREFLGDVDKTSRELTNVPLKKLAEIAQQRRHNGPRLNLAAPPRDVTDGCPGHRSGKHRWIVLADGTFCCWCEAVQSENEEPPTD